MPDPILLPRPQSLQRSAAHFPLRPRQLVRLACPRPRELLPAAQIILDAVRAATTHDWALIAGAGGPEDAVALSIGLNPRLLRPQGYTLSIDADGIEIVARDPAGAFYAAQTLAQLLRQFPRALPALCIEDAPDFPVRGVMLDISRDKVPSVQTLYALVDDLASLKINQLQLYTEHTFAYRAHPAAWAQASPMTGQEIMQLDRYCRERFIDLVPNQNSFGHLERWLNLPQYRPLAETVGFDTPFGRREGAFSLCPTDPTSLAFIEGLYDELLPHFSSRLFNVGCDETWDLGQGRSKSAVEQWGKHRIYLDFLLKIHRLVADRGRTMQFWGDIILHQPELVPQLPKDLIALEWGYEADHPFDRDGGIFREAGVPFYVCPGTSSWLSISGRTDNALANLRNAAESGLKHGAIGYLNTDWGDQGHLQYLPISFLPLAAGAAYSWNYSGNRDLDLREAVSLHVFRDSAGVMGHLAAELGNVYLKISKQRPNSTVLFWRLIGGPEKQKELEGVSREEYDAAESAIDNALSTLDEARMGRPDAGLIGDEFRNAAALLRHACRRGRFSLDPAAERPVELAGELRALIAEHRRLWLARNRIGGLAESARRLEARLADYDQ